MTMSLDAMIQHDAMIILSSHNDIVMTQCHDSMTMSWHNLTMSCSEEEESRAATGAGVHARTVS